jgi:hypothetical protein
MLSTKSRLATTEWPNPFGNFSLCSRRLHLGRTALRKVELDFNFFRVAIEVSGNRRFEEEEAGREENGILPPLDEEQEYDRSTCSTT